MAPTMLPSSSRSRSGERAGMVLAGDLQSPTDSNRPANDMEASMNPQTLTNPVEILERKVAGLAELPDRVGALELQVSQLRSEIGVGEPRFLGCVKRSFEL
jgi:hypothetical protein